MGETEGLEVPLMDAVGDCDTLKVPELHTVDELEGLPDTELLWLGAREVLTVAVGH